MPGNYEIVLGAASTSLGTQDFTFSGFGTPKGAIVICGPSTVHGTTVNHAQISVGYYDGTRARCLSVSDEDNVTPTDGYRQGDRTNVIRTLNAADGTTTGTGTGSFITGPNGGLRITWTDNPPLGYQVAVILIGGTVTDVYVDDFSNPGGLDTEQVITAPGFQSDLIHVLSQCGQSFGGASNNGLSITQGFVVRDGSSPPSQRSIGITSSDAASTTNIGARFSDTCAAHVVGAGADRLEFNNISGSGFSVFARDANTAGGIDFAYMCVKGVTAKIVTYDTKITTGSHNITGAGFTPAFSMLLDSLLSSVASDSSSPGAEGFGISVMTATDQYCASIAMDDNLTGPTTSNTESIVDNIPIYLRNGGADFIVANWTGFISDGETIDYVTTDGTARKIGVLFIASGAAPPPDTFQKLEIRAAP